MIHYGGASEDEAIRMVTLNPAWIIGVDDKTGSIDVGKDADRFSGITIRSPPTPAPRRSTSMATCSSTPRCPPRHHSLYRVMHDAGGFGSDDEEDGQ